MTPMRRKARNYTADLLFVLERVTGIEPALSAWEVHRPEPSPLLTCARTCPQVAVADPYDPPLIAR
jgi:hypothetical protein